MRQIFELVKDSVIGWGQNDGIIYAAALSPK